ncbi:MAG: hypothetical protein M3Y87_09660 [Myxococcota bacterium]|nr:hypothetical protein [Myxococcota bacterium]
MRSSLPMMLALSLALVACGSDPAADPDGGSTPRIDSGTTPIDGGPIGTDAGPVVADSGPRPDGGPNADFATVDFGPHPLAVGQERTVCVVLDAGNEMARQVRAIRTHLPIGSHHMILYRTSEPVRETPYPCFPFADGGEAIFIAETVEASLEYPADAALAFGPSQHVRLEIHQVNYTEAPIGVTASVTFDFYPVGEPAHAPVQFLFTGDMGLTLPPRETTTVHSFHRVPSGARIFALTSHTHSLGTYAAIHRARSETDFDEPPLHESTEWAEPPLDTFDPPLELPSSEGLRLTCEYMNNTEATVTFGLGFEDEMCFLWAYWY